MIRQSVQKKVSGFNHLKCSNINENQDERRRRREIQIKHAPSELRGGVGGVYV